MKKRSALGLCLGAVLALLPHAGWAQGPANEKLVFTWAWRDTPERESLVTVLIRPDGQGSLLTLTRRLLELRAREPVLQGGVQEPREAAAGLVAYRRGDERRFLVVANFTHAPLSYALRVDGPGRVVLSTLLDREGERVADQVRLRADEGLVIALDAAPGDSRAA